MSYLSPGPFLLKERSGKDTAEPSCSLLVISCDKYQDLWRPFFHQFWKHWPDCPFPVHLGANAAAFAHTRVTTLQAGPDESWSKNLRWFLEQLRTDYVLTLLDDYFLDRSIATGDVLQHLRHLQSLRGTLMRLFPKPGPDGWQQPGQAFGAIHRDAPYRVSAQPAIWNRTRLLNLLDDTEDAWQWEWQGTERSRTLPGFYATSRPVIPYRHVVERGEWFWFAARSCRRWDIGCDWDARKVMNPLTAGKKAINRWRKDLVSSCLPVHLRRRQ
jgi:hypothetical protein